MVTAEHPPKGIIIIFLNPIPILFMEQRTGLSLPASVIIHLASIFFSDNIRKPTKGKIELASAHTLLVSPKFKTVFI